MFNGREFLKDNFPSPQNVLALYRAYGIQSPTPAAIEKWFQRGSVPGDSLAVLLCLMELERGRPIGLAQYLRGQ